MSTIEVQGFDYLDPFPGPGPWAQGAQGWAWAMAPVAMYFRFQIKTINILMRIKQDKPLMILVIIPKKLHNTQILILKINI